jgi:hypothetical protein
MGPNVAQLACMTMATDSTTTESGVETANSKPNPPSEKNFADPAEPTWAPPEHQPEPRPCEPILDNPSQTNPSPNTNSPA